MTYLRIPTFKNATGLALLANLILLALNQAPKNQLVQTLVATFTIGMEPIKLDTLIPKVPPLSDIEIYIERRK